MPSYDWTCPQCGHRTTTLNPVVQHDVPPSKCSPEPERSERKGPDGKPEYDKFESCGWDKPEGWKKRIGTTRFVLRGTGWARDGYEKW